MARNTSKPIGFFFRWALVYFMAATLLTMWLRGDALIVSLKFLTVTTNAGVELWHALALVILLLVLSWQSSATISEFLTRLLRTVLMLLVCFIFLAAFSAVKTSLPYLAELAGLRHFFADPFFAGLDRALHLGVDPWEYAHALTDRLGLQNFAAQSAAIYGLWWTIPAFYMPAILVLLGEPDHMTRRFLILYLFSWIMLGNVIALLGLSAGPVYFDRAFGTDRFPELLAALEARGLGQTWFGAVQPRLWEAYAEQAQAIGTGISAFPSIHVAAVTVAMLYLIEKNFFAGLVGVVFTTSVLFISVWVGYHYAVDGYFSILAVVALNAWLKRRPVPG
jgi:hypothetical protein